MRIDVIHIQTQFGDTTTVKTLIATFGISAALLAPAATLAATTPITTTAQTATANAATRVATPDSKEMTNAARIAMNKRTSDNKSFGVQANDDRQGLSRIQEFSRQLGATN